MPSNGLVTTPPGSPAPAATEIPLRHRPLAFVAFVGGKPQAHEGFGGGAGAAISFALFAHVAAGCEAVELSDAERDVLLAMGGARRDVAYARWRPAAGCCWRTNGRCASPMQIR